MNAVELLPQGTKPQRPTAIAYEWPITLGASDTMHTDLSWSLAELGAPASTAKDLLRVVAAAYIADRTNSRPAQALQRDLHLSVHLDEPQAWTPAALNHTVDLLHWLTGDIWTLEVLAAQPAPDLAEHAPTAGHVRAVSLLSGGLDSLCGALLRLDQAESTLFLGHVDSANAVSKAQRAIHDELRERRPELRYQRYALRPTGPVRESTPRTRSLLFMAMAVAAASGNGASEVVVPENGFTSINPPLEPSRGGPLTTRSTHPWTFHALSELMRALSLDTIAVHNPYDHLTKGELVAEALRPRSADDRHLAAVTLSCAKPNRPAQGRQPQPQLRPVHRLPGTTRRIPRREPARRHYLPRRHPHRRCQGRIPAPPTPRHRRLAVRHRTGIRRHPHPRVWPVAAQHRLRRCARHLPPRLEGTPTCLRLLACQGSTATLTSLPT